MKMKNWIECTDNVLIKCSKIEKKFEREFFGGGIPSFLENSQQECEEIVGSFSSSFRLVPHNVNRVPPIMWPKCEESVRPK